MTGQGEYVMGEPVDGPNEDGSFPQEYPTTVAETRVESLENALGDILDVVAGWTRPMGFAEKFEAIERIATAALAGEGSSLAPAGASQRRDQ